MMRAQGQQVSLEVPFEQRLIDLQAQIDQLSLTLQLWRDTQDHLQPMERRLAQLTDQCADILDRWKETGDRHARAVNQLETRLLGWNEVEARLQHEASQRFGELERAIEHEWASLRQIHQEPVKELRDQAAALTELSAAAAESAQTGLERAEARLATLETELHRRMDEMTFEIRGLVSGLRLEAGGGDALALRPAAASWPLEGVARLHQQLRDDGDVNPTPAPPLDAPEGSMALVLRADRRAPEAPRSEPVAPETPVSAPPVEHDTRTAAEARTKRALIALAVAAFVGAMGFAVYLYQQVGAAADRAAAAQQETARIVAASEARIRETREEAAGQVAEARDAAARAQMVSDVLAAPDLVRFNLVGGDATNGWLTAQVLFSRSRGTVLSGSQLPPLPQGSIYQMWLITPLEMLSAGTFEPDASGRATFAAANLTWTSNPIVSARVTLEPVPGREAPSGPAILRRAPAPAPAQP